MTKDNGKNNIKKLQQSAESISRAFRPFQEQIDRFATRMHVFLSIEVTWPLSQREYLRFKDWQHCPYRASDVASQQQGFIDADDYDVYGGGCNLIKHIVNMQSMNKFKGLYEMPLKDDMYQEAFAGMLKYKEYFIAGVAESTRQAQTAIYKAIEKHFNDIYKHCNHFERSIDNGRTGGGSKKSYLQYKADYTEQQLEPDPELYNITAIDQDQDRIKAEEASGDYSIIFERFEDKKSYEKFIEDMDEADFNQASEPESVKQAYNKNWLAGGISEGDKIHFFKLCRRGDIEYPYQNIAIRKTGKPDKNRLINKLYYSYISYKKDNKKIIQLGSYSGITQYRRADFLSKKQTAGKAYKSNALYSGLSFHEVIPNGLINTRSELKQYNVKRIDLLIKQERKTGSNGNYFIVEVAHKRTDPEGNYYIVYDHYKKIKSATIQSGLYFEEEETITGQGRDQERQAAKVIKSDHYKIIDRMKRARRSLHKTANGVPDFNRLREEALQVIDSFPDLQRQLFKLYYPEGIRDTRRGKGKLQGIIAKLLKTNTANIQPIRDNGIRKLREYFYNKYGPCLIRITAKNKVEARELREAGNPFKIQIAGKRKRKRKGSELWRAKIF